MRLLGQRSTRHQHAARGVEAEVPIERGQPPARTRSSGSRSRKTTTAQQDVVWLAYLSNYLRGREDGGERPGALTREDMTGFVSWLRARRPVKSRRALVISATRRHVQFGRRHLEPSPSPAGRVGGSFQLYSEDLPERTLRDPDEPCCAVVAFLRASLTWIG